MSDSKNNEQRCVGSGDGCIQRDSSWWNNVLDYLSTELKERRTEVLVIVGKDFFLDYKGG